MVDRINLSVVLCHVETHTALNLFGCILSGYLPTQKGIDLGFQRGHDHIVPDHQSIRPIDQFPHYSSILLIEGGIVADVTLRALRIEPIQAVTLCTDCGQEYSTVKYAKVCPRCGSENTYLLQGNEYAIKEIEAM